MGLVDDVLTMRVYANLKQEYDAACTSGDQKRVAEAFDDPRFALVREIEAERVAAGWAADEADE